MTRLFAPYALTNPARYQRAWTPRRLAAARKAVQREVDKVPLFPELARFSTVEERVEQVQTGEDAWLADMRAQHCRLTRSVRRRYFSLAQPERCGLRTYWDRCGRPRDPLYMTDLLTRIERGESAWDWIRELDSLPEQGRIWRENEARRNAQQRGAV